LEVKAFINGKIYSSFKPLRVISGFVVYGDRVIYSGSSEKAVEIARGLNGLIIDLGGRVVMPGFIDSHLHIDTLGIALNTLDLRGVGSIRELKDKLKAYSSKSRFKWIMGHGWDHELFEEKRWPNRWDIDEVVPDKPVLLTRICLHAGVVNTRGLRESRVLEENIPGVQRDERGEPTGVLFEAALKHTREKIKAELSTSDYVDLIKTAQEHLVSQGVTTVGVAGCSLKVLKALTALWARGELKIRFRVYLYPRDGEVDVLELLGRMGVKKGFGDEYLRIMGVKLFADGSLGSRTAWLTKPYSDDPSTRGEPSMDPEELKKTIKRAHDLGLQVAVHAIGDRALDTVLEAYSIVRVDKMRHRVEHASVIRDDQLELLKKIKPAISLQPHFIITDWWAKNRLGVERIKWLYRFKTLLELELTIGFSTDAPVEPTNPWETIYAAVTRGKYDGVPYYEDTKGESLGVVDALHAYTMGSASVMWSEGELGTLEPGKLADFIVVDVDPLTIPEGDLRRVRVLETYVGGVRVYP